MTQRLFLVDTEASGKTPYSGVLTDFGIVDFETRAWFHGHLWDSTPHPDRPALPVVPDGATPNPWTESVATPDGPALRLEPGTLAGVFYSLRSWLDTFGGRPVFVSDNPGFDWQWIAYGLDQAGIDNPFGWSSRRIGDLAAGLNRRWRDTNSWKRHRKTRHDHNPVNDSLGNAEALHAILTRHNQIPR